MHVNEAREGDETPPQRPDGAKMIQQRDQTNIKNQNQHLHCYQHQQDAQQHMHGPSCTAGPTQCAVSHLTALTSHTSLIFNNETLEQRRSACGEREKALIQTGVKEEVTGGESSFRLAAKKI